MHVKIILKNHPQQKQVKITDGLKNNHDLYVGEDCMKK